MTRLAASFAATRHTRTHRGLSRLMQSFALLLLIATGDALIVTRAGAAAPATEKANAVVVTKCQQDLAQRLNIPVKDIAVIDAEAKVWPDAALGMPEPGKVYAQVQTPGWRIVLEARQIRYLYTASDHGCKFGGPLSLWDYSMLYVLPVPQEPNLNGDLYQCSLVGTNHLRLVSGVDSYYPQAKGVVLFTRRTSRSGFELLSIKAGAGKEAQRLHSAFSIGAAALNEAQDTWAAFVRPGLGNGWKVVVARIGQDDVVTLPLPDDAQQPQRIVWSGERLMIQVGTAKGTACFATTPAKAAPEWHAVDHVQFQEAQGYRLNKSEWLEITQTGTEKKPCVEVSRVWFTGDRNDVATINGLTLRGHELLNAGYAFIWGEQHGQAAAYTVDISSGEVTPGFHGVCQDIKPFTYPPSTTP